MGHPQFKHIPCAGCPICGQPGAIIEGIDEGEDEHDTRHYVFHTICGASTPRTPFPKEAWAMWNERLVAPYRDIPKDN